jgi:hypothetical protein
MIRLVTVMGHGPELLPHFIKHYLQYVDEIHIVAYISGASSNLKSEILKIIKDYKNVVMCDVVRDRVFDWDKVTQIYNYTKSKHPNDWWVVADIDEFHLYPNDNLKDLIDVCEKNGYELVRGGFIDRIGPNGSFPELQNDISLWEQFPNSGFFRFPMSGANPNKVCVMKGHVELTSGQHYAKLDGYTTWKWQGWNHPLIYNLDYVQVHHFKWDKTSIDRIKAVAEINQEYSYSKEYQQMFLSLKKSRYKINLTTPEYMFVTNTTKPTFEEYNKWNKLSKTIISI